jgi:hypothetical protein
MTAAATITPAFNGVTRPAPKRIEPVTAPEQVDSPAMPSPGVVEPQHMQALARANEVRLARASLKRQVAAGKITASEVVRECPWQAESMTIAELLSSQRRWGKARSRKLIVSTGLTETKRLGTLTERQRRLLAAALEAKCAGC